MSDERAAFMAAFGRVIRRLRDDDGFSGTELARRAGLSQSALSRFETGQTMPDVFELLCLAQELGTSPGAIMTLCSLEQEADASGSPAPEEHPDSRRLPRHRHPRR